VEVSILSILLELALLIPITGRHFIFEQCKQRM